MNRESWLRDFEMNSYPLGLIAVRFKACTNEEFEEIRISHDIKRIGDVLQTAWENAPDKGWIHELPGWGILCDLCSDYVFGDDDKENVEY